MSNEEFKINLTTPGEYHFRTGDAPEIIKNDTGIFKTTINGPWEFYSKKYGVNSSQNFPKEGMALRFSYEEKSLIFYENVKDTSGGLIIEGSLNLSKELVNLEINSGKAWTSSHLSQLLKFNRLLFANTEECLELVTNLQKFTAKITTEIQDINDKQGNKTQAIIQQASHQIKLQFTLAAPVFKHDQNKSTFMVNINLEVRDRAIEFWLESVELKEIIDSRVREEIDAQVTKFDNVGIACLQKGE